MLCKESTDLILQAFKKNIHLVTSVADLGCLSRILIFTHPGSRISDSGSGIQKTKERGEKIFYHSFYVATNFIKFKIILVLIC
jgi:hypothetical protein